MSTDIEGLRLRITGSSTGLSQAIDGARAKVNGMIAAVKSRFASFRQNFELPSIGAQSAPVIKDPFAAFRTSSAQAQQQVQSFTNSVRQSNADLQSVTFGGLAAKLAAVVGVASLARSAINLASSAEQTATSLKVLLGSASKAADMIRELRTLAASTPLEFSGLTENAKLMLNFGIAANQVLPNLRILGDITGGNAEKMHLMSLAFAQSSAAGRLMGQDLLQMINGGFNPLLEISERTGVSMADLKKRMEDGGISFAAVRAAFQSATAEGGRFAGMMDAQSKTFAGAMGKLKDAWQLFLVKIGNEAIPHLSNLAANFTNLINATGGLSGETIVLAVKFGAAALAFRQAMIYIPPLIAGIRALATAQAFAAGLSGNWIGLGAGLLAATGAVLAMNAAFAGQNEAVAKSTVAVVSRKEAQDALNKAMAESAKQMKELNSLQLQQVQIQQQNIQAQLAVAEATEQSSRKAYQAANAQIVAKRDEQRANVVPNSGFSGVLGATNAIAQDAFDKEAEAAKAAAFDKHKKLIDAAAAATQGYRDQLKGVGDALAKNTQYWQEQSVATRKSFELPIDKLKADLKSLAEQVAQGGLEQLVFERAAAKSIADYKASLEQAQPQQQQTQFAGIVAGSQADVQTVFRFQNQFAQLGAPDKQAEANQLLRDIRQELINNGKIASQPPAQT